MTRLSLLNDKNTEASALEISIDGISAYGSEKKYLRIAVKLLGILPSNHLIGTLLINPLSVSINNRFIGYAYSDQTSPTIVLGSGSTGSLYFSMPLAMNELAEIEKNRQFADINFSFDMSGKWLGPLPPEKVAILSAGRIQLQHKVAKSDWITILEQFGLKKVILLEVPKTDEAFYPLAQKIEDGWNSYWKGEPISALQMSASVLDGIKDHIKTTFPELINESGDDKGEVNFNKMANKIGHSGAFADLLDSNVRKLKNLRARIHSGASINPFEVEFALHFTSVYLSILSRALKEYKAATG